jgi:hypothetical protein
MRKKKKKPIFELSKTPIEQFKKECIAKCDIIEKITLYTYIVQMKVVDNNYYKTDKDYECFLRLNPFNPLSFLIIIYMILRGFFTRELDYECFWHNLTTIFTWEEHEF